MKNYKVTVLIAHHNYQEFLTSAIESVKAQTYPCYTCIIDDCSKNQKIVEDITRTAFGKSDNLIIEKKQNIFTHPFYSLILLEKGPYGPSYARNRGIERCWNTTDIFAILDADDEMYPTKIAECVRTIGQCDSEIGVVYADHDTLNTTTNQIYREYREPFNLLRLREECIVHSGSVINKKALEAVKEETGYYDETMRTCEDYDLWMRISEKFIIVHIPKSLSLIRVQPKNSTDTVAKDIWQRNIQRVYQKLKTRNG